MPQDPYAEFQKPANPYADFQAPAQVASVAVAAHPASFIDTLRNNFHQNTAPKPSDGTIGTALQNFGGRVATNLAGMALHPLDTVAGTVEGARAVLAGDPNNPISNRIGEFKADWAKDKPMAVEKALGDVGTGVVTDGMLRGAGALAAKIPKPFVSGVNEPIIGTSTTPAQRYASAKNLGVNLDAADATNSPLLQGVKKFNEHSLLGGATYENAKAANTAALQGSTDNFLNKLYDGDRESGGQAIQAALKANMDKLHGDATAGYQNLAEQTKGMPIPGAVNVAKTARALSDAAQGTYADFPSLAPRQSMSVLGDMTKASPDLGFEKMHQLRSDVLEMTRNNPDFVKNSGGAMLQQVTGALDNALTDPSGLSPKQVETMRAADSAWREMKQTYDDPSNPLHYAIKPTTAPSSLYGKLGSQTPEMARELTERLGDQINPFRRGVVENALKATNDGSPNLKTFGTQINRVPAQYRAELFSPDQNMTIRDIANTSNLMGKDFNPSGSGKLAQKFGEASMLGSTLLGHPTGALPLIQYPIAKAMNSPAIVDWMMNGDKSLLPPIPVDTPVVALPKKKDR